MSETKIWPMGNEGDVRRIIRLRTPRVPFCFPLPEPAGPLYSVAWLGQGSGRPRVTPFGGPMSFLRVLALACAVAAAGIAWHRQTPPVDDHMAHMSPADLSAP